MECIFEKLKFNNAKPIPKAWALSVEITQKIIRQNEAYPKLENEYNMLKGKHQNLKRLSSKIITESRVQENQQEINKLEQIVNDYKKQLNDILNEKQKIQNKIEEIKQKKFESEKKNNLLASEIAEVEKQIKSIEESILKLESRAGEQDSTLESFECTIKAIQKMSKSITIVANKCKKVRFDQSNEGKISAVNSLTSPKSISPRPNFKIADQRKRAKSFSSSNLKPLKLEHNSKSLSEILEKTSVMHKGCITTIVFSNNGKYFACGSDDNVVCIYNFSNSLPVESYQMDKSVVSLNFNSADNLLLIACFDTIQIFEITNLSFIPRPDKVITKSKIFHTEFVSNDKFVVCGEQCKIKLYKVGKKGPKFESSLIPKFPTIANWVCPAFGSNEFAAGYQTGALRIWDPHSCRIIYVNTVHQRPIIQILFHGSCFVSLSEDGHVVFTNTLSRVVERTIKLKGCSIHDKTRMAIYGKSILIGGDDGLVYEFSIHDGKLINKWKSSHSTAISAIYANKCWVVTGDREGKIKVWID